MTTPETLYDAYNTCDALGISPLKIQELLLENTDYIVSDTLLLTYSGVCALSSAAGERGMEYRKQLSRGRVGHIYYIRKLCDDTDHEYSTRYVGSTTRTPEERFKEHYNTAISELSLPFYRAVFAEGWKHFVLDQEHTHTAQYLCEKELRQMEKKEIDAWAAAYSVWNKTAPKKECNPALPENVLNERAAVFQKFQQSVRDICGKDITSYMHKK